MTTPTAQSGPSADFAVLLDLADRWDREAGRMVVRNLLSAKEVLRENHAKELRRHVGLAMAARAEAAALSTPPAGAGDAVTYPDDTGWAGPGHGRLGDASPCCGMGNGKLVAKASVDYFKPLHCSVCNKGSWGLHYPDANKATQPAATGAGEYTGESK